MNPRLVRLLPLLAGVLVAAVVVLLSWAQTSLPGFTWLRRLEWLTYDWRVNLAINRPHEVASNLGVVGIDEATLQELNQRHGYKWPLPRSVYAHLVAELTAQGARSIVFDVFFIDRARPAAGARRDSASPVAVPLDDDEQFALKIKESGRVVLGAPPWPGKRGELVLPHPMFRNEAAFIGHAHGHIDPDGVLRRIRPFVDDPKGGRVWQMGIAMAAMELGIDLSKAVIRVGAIDLETAGGEIITLPLDAGGFLLVDWSLRLTDRRLLHRGLASVLRSWEARQQPVVPGHTKSPSRQEWAGRLVLVGATGSGNNLNDRGATPLSPNDYLMSANWNVANSILTGQFIQQPSVWGQRVILLFMAGLSGWASWRLRALWAGFAVLVLGALYVWWAVWLYTRWRIWVPVFLPIAGSLVMTHASLIVFRTLVDRGNRRRVRSIFGRIVAPDVMEMLIQQPGIAAESTHRELTVFFADIRGFTAFTDAQHELAQRKIAEGGLAGAEAESCSQLHAAASLDTINLYLATVADTVKRFGGTLDKYIGDCVMAFWGAPLADKDHASKAVQAAVATQRAIHALNARRQQAGAAPLEDSGKKLSQTAAPESPPAILGLGIAINSGPMMVGFMGSESHLSNYTVFGREVNIAARLEHFAQRGEIIITRNTQSLVEGRHPELAETFRKQGSVTVKGIVEKLEIYEVSWKI